MPDSPGELRSAALRIQRCNSSGTQFVVYCGDPPSFVARMQRGNYGVTERAVLISDDIQFPQDFISDPELHAWIRENEAQGRLKLTD